MSEKYPLGYCLNPIHLKVNGSVRLLSCGRCDACRQKKSYKNQMLCSLEYLSSECVYFVTLTYDNDSVPLIKFEYDPVTELYVFRVLNQRLLSDPKFDFNKDLFSSVSLDNDLEYIFSKVNCNPDDGQVIPFLYKRDLQNFLKRFRYYFNVYGKVRYFACGEYGPNTLRPHFHLLLFFSFKPKAQTVYRCCVKAWKYGFVDMQKCKSDTSQYVTSYVNSSGSLPFFYEAFGFPPFCLHSSHLGEKVFQERIEEVYSSSFDDFVKPREFAGLNYPVIPWQQLTSYYFPRCENYSLSTFDERKSKYLIYNKVQSIYGFGILGSPSFYAKIIYDDIVSSSPRIEKLSYFRDIYSRILSFRERVSSDDLTFNLSDSSEYYINAFYRVLRLSHHFIYDICDCNENLYDSRIRHIDSFYKYIELKRLNEFYNNIESCQSSQYFDIQLFYDDPLYECSEFNFKDSFYRKYLKSKVSLQSYMLRKHKHRNDTYSIFYEENLKLHKQLFNYE